MIGGEVWNLPPPFFFLSWVASFALSSLSCHDVGRFRWFARGSWVGLGLRVKQCVVLLQSFVADEVAKHVA